jgi:hypothetical protein
MEDIMSRNQLFGLTAGAALALVSGGAWAQSSGQPGGSSSTPGAQHDQSGKQQQQKGGQGEQPGSSTRDQNKGFGAGVGGENQRDQNACECPCGTPGAKPKGSFGSGLPGEKPGEKQQGKPGSQGEKQQAPKQGTPGSSGEGR